MKSKKKMKKREQLRTKIRYLISSKTKNTDDYDEKYMKIKFYSDNEWPLNKTIGTRTMEIFVSAIFHENNKYYSQVFWDECLYKI